MLGSFGFRCCPFSILCLCYKLGLYCSRSLTLHLVYPTSMNFFCARRMASLYDTSTLATKLPRPSLFARIWIGISSCFLETPAFSSPSATSLTSAHFGIPMIRIGVRGSMITVAVFGTLRRRNLTFSSFTGRVGLSLCTGAIDGSSGVFPRTT